MDTHEIFSQYGGDDLSKNPLVVLSHEAEEEEVEAAATIKKSPSVAPSVVPSVASSVAPSSKRKHYDTNASIQLRVLQREEELQRKKDKLLDIEIEVAMLKKQKLEMEISRMTAVPVEAIRVVPQQNNSISCSGEQLQELLDTLLSQQRQQSSQQSEL